MKQNEPKEQRAAKTELKYLCQTQGGCPECCSGTLYHQQ